MRTKYKLLVHESDGQKYEDLFVKIMTNADQDFQPVKAHGNIGDRGNDGYCSNSGKYYQVYAPEKLPTNNSKLINKMKEDFYKLKSYWEDISPIKRYYFVVNDKYQGVSPHIFRLIKEIETENNLDEANILLSRQVEKILFNLEEDIIESIIGSSCQDNTKYIIYQNLINEITSKMYLNYWQQISQSLIDNCIMDYVIDGFSDITMMIFKTEIPNSIPKLKNSILELSKRTELLINHFTKSPYTYLSEDFKWWRHDMRWKREWIENQDEYKEKYDLYANWRTELYWIHSNLVHALNLFSSEVRIHINAQYFMGQNFTLVDHEGIYNQLEGYERIPANYYDINS